MTHRFYHQPQNWRVKNVIFPYKPNPEISQTPFKLILHIPTPSPRPSPQLPSILNTFYHPKIKIATGNPPESDLNTDYAVSLILTRDAFWYSNFDLFRVAHTHSRHPRQQRQQQRPKTTRQQQRLHFAAANTTRGCRHPCKELVLARSLYTKHNSCHVYLITAKYG